MHFKVSSIFGLLVILFVGRTPSAEEDVLEYAKVGNWHVRVDRTLGDGCFLLAEYVGGTAFRIGFDPSGYRLYVVIADTAWHSIEVGQTYDIEIQFGDEEKWVGGATGVSFDDSSGVPMLWAPIKGGADLYELFFDEFMSESNVMLFYQGDEISNLSLSGSRRAAESLFTCQSRYGWKSNDPFAKEPDSKTDPFQKN